MDEAFDCWSRGKNSDDYHLDFDAWWRRDLAAMVLRDRNHPSVIIWSIGQPRPKPHPKPHPSPQPSALSPQALSPSAPSSQPLSPQPQPCSQAGNEIPIRAEPLGYNLSAQLAAFVRARDPSHRPVTSAYPGVDERADAFFAPLDIAGYNYSPQRYAKDHARVPGRVMVATESFPADSYDYWQV